MDRTLGTRRTRNKAALKRNHNAWQVFTDGENRCPYCNHEGDDHLMSSARPYIYRPFLPNERKSDFDIYDYTTPEGKEVEVRYVRVALRAELLVLYCMSCAEGLQTHQVLCYRGTWPPAR